MYLKAIDLELMKIVIKTKIPNTGKSYLKKSGNELEIIQRILKVKKIRITLRVSNLINSENG